MIERNNGFTEQEKLQNRFTSFITTSMRRARIDYLRKEKSRTQRTYEMEDAIFTTIPDNDDFVSELCDSDALAYALRQLDERESYILIARVLEEKSFEEIGDKLGLKYKGVAAIYYRTTAKLRDIIRGN